MKALFALLVFSSLSSVHAVAKKWSGNIGVTSNYLWRGISFSDEEPAAQGGVDYDSGGGLSLGTWLSQSQGYGDGLEVDLYSRYSVPLGDDWSLHIGGIRYHYPNDESASYQRFYLGGTWKNATLQISRWDYDSIEYRVMFSMAGVDLMVLHDQDYFAAGSSYTYYRGKRSFRLMEGMDGGVELGYVRHGDVDSAGSSNYYHSLLFLKKTIKGFDATLFYNDTNRKNPVGNQSKGDDSLGLSIIKRF